MMSMLKFMNDQKDFNKLISSVTLRSGEDEEYNLNQYKAAYDFIAENGIQVFGLVTYSKKSSIEKILRSDAVAYVQTSPDEYLQ